MFNTALCINSSIPKRTHISCNGNNVLIRLINGKQRKIRFFGGLAGLEYPLVGERCIGVRFPRLLESNVKSLIFNVKFLIFIIGAPPRFYKHY